MTRENTNLRSLYLKWFNVDEYSYDDYFLNDIRYLRKIVHFIPFLVQVGICNSVAMGVANEESDIDLFVVTKKNRVYIVRLWMVLIMHLVGKRRHNLKVKNRFCLSFFVDEENIDMQDLMIEDDYYFDFWLKNIWWLLDNDSFLEKWSNANEVGMSQSLFNWNYSSRGLFDNFWDMVNFVVGVLQRLKAHNTYKQKKFPKGVIFEEGVIKCHDQDIRWDFRRFIESSWK